MLLQIQDVQKREVLVEDQKKMILQQKQALGLMISNQQRDARELDLLIQQQKNEAERENMIAQ